MPGGLGVASIQFGVCLLTNLPSNSARSCLSRVRPGNGFGELEDVVDDRYWLHCINFDTSYVQNGLVVAEIRRPACLTSNFA